MSSLVEPYYNMTTQINFDQRWIEGIILKLADAFEIRVKWDTEAAMLTGAFALAGGLVGGYAGGRMGAALGAGLGGAAGFGVSTMVSLTEIWDSVKAKLKELVYIVFNYLRRLDPADYVHALNVLMACSASKRELVMTILDFVAHKLGREVISSITAA
ncbi:protein C19orf12 homolog [Maniola jurtina]|uniref:protein C19orf12 homolog n=1 Tax=Maniola jurtina TaxID=191418 RepID=UPI001E68E7DA|nr:protein C19orf12 homolog [Maniola jurtina]